MERTPAVHEGSNVIRPGSDLFGVKATQLLLRAWEAAFDGREEDARSAADEAIGLHSHETDGTDGTLFLRQRMLIRLVTGDLNGAMDDLEVLMALPGMRSVWELRLDPVYDPLRNRADFESLITQGR